MSHPQRETVRIGASGARIVAVTDQRIDYIDLEGRDLFIELGECASKWERGHEERRGEFLPLGDASDQDVAAWNARCVGLRGALDDPPWAQFMNERNTRFEFESCEDLYAELLVPLMKAGWQTFDTD